ncbi:MAG: hypothetical protein M1825_003055 [Sarcosagium campestre]|nr:MAG: hypothetical protein M1825_003055 [Sarcosagium campestre]
MASSIWNMLVDVALFWRYKFVAWWTRKQPREVLYERLASATSFEEYEDAAFQLDAIVGHDLWRQNPTSKFYDYRLIYERLQAIIEAWEDNDILALVNLLRSGLVRNLGNITAPRLFNRAYAGTKLLIEDYITQVALAIEHVTTLPTSPVPDHGFNSQAKLDLLHDTRQAFGRSSLVLQGGAIFGLCHLGVVKALHLRGLLPRIITGTATGALIAALVGVHTEDELLKFLTSDGIDLTAFGTRKSKQNGKVSASAQQTGWFDTLNRRIHRFLKEGYFLDVRVLEQLLRANVGDLTFEEAYAKTRRVLNITVSTAGRSGVPSLLNYLTAPNVVIWSAALASNASSRTMYSPVILQCKDETGNIVPWGPAKETTFRSWTQESYTDRDSPLSRIAELFNVNHFIVSQARPYLAPFLRSDTYMPSPTNQRSSINPGGTNTNIISSMTNSLSSITNTLLQLVALEIRHRLDQLDSLGLLASSIRRFLVDESIPAASLTLVPELTLRDLLRLLETPTRDSVEYWILRGERSVWPAIGTLKVRCAVEVELDRGYQLVRRRKPLDLTPGAPGVFPSVAYPDGRRKRVRAASVDDR